MKLKVLNPRIKISETGRPYIEIDELVRARIARLKRERQIEETGTFLSDVKPKQNEKASDSNGSQ